MQKECVTLEIAKKLKEVGFDEPCIAGYNSYNILKHNIAIVCGDEHDYISISRHDKKLLAPIWQQAIRWLQEQHGIIVCPTPYTEFLGRKVTGFYRGEIIHVDGTLLCERDSNYPTFEEAREAAILEALKHVKQQ